jgi:divalent metal cation (Fe/Co/Zn/Cd) transporter
MATSSRSGERALDAAVLVVGLLCQLLVNAWWVDGATSVLIIYFVVREGFEALRAEGD